MSFIEPKKGYALRNHSHRAMTESDKIDISCSISTLITRLNKVVSELGAAQNAVQYYTDPATAAKCLTDAAYHLKDCTHEQVQSRQPK